MPSRQGHVVNAAGVATALAERAEAVCSQYLPHGRRQGRYWVAGDLDGARGRSLFVRLAPPGAPGKWTDAADGSHGDLLDLIRHRSHAPTLRAVLGVQRTWLDARSPAKAGVATPRKALGRVYGRAVRFGRPADGDALLVGEGIETVLSVVTAMPVVTAAAALSAGSLGAFAPPPGTARLVIARDNDAEGERAALRLARRCARAGVLAAVVVPEGGDFNDDLLALGPHALAARLAPLLRARG